VLLRPPPDEPELLELPPELLLPELPLLELLLLELLLPEPLLLRELVLPEPVPDLLAPDPLVAELDPPVWSWTVVAWAAPGSV
jgi:hypothetical protein